MSQPTYNDMGKVCKDFFAKGFYLGILKLCVKNKPFANLETTATGIHNLEDQTASAEFEVKGSLPSWGLTTTGKWNTSNLLTTKLDCADKLAGGLKLSLEGQYNLETAVKLGKLGTQYKIDMATLDLGLEGGDEANLALNGSAVVGYRNFLAGYQFAYDTNEGTLKKSNVAVGYFGNGWTVHSVMDNAETIGAIVHYRVKNDVEIGINGSYTSGDDSATRYGCGLKYIMNPCTSFKAKIDNTATVTMGCEMKVTQGVLLTMCTECDASTKTGKVGAALEFGQ